MTPGRAPIASWRPRPAATSALALRHDRPNAVHRERYYAHHWPDRAHRDLLEHPGRWVVVWAAVGLLGLATVVAAPVSGDESTAVGVLDLAMLTLSLVIHGWNAARARRRRSVLLTPVLAGAVAAGALQLAGQADIMWGHILALVLIAWAPIAAADIVAPGTTYLARGTVEGITPTAPGAHAS